tara:strand:+ start:281 stop:562 length:282 start_codon:yes stop_codon:yes gene_type:complete
MRYSTKRNKWRRNALEKKKALRLKNKLIKNGVTPAPSSTFSDILKVVPRIKINDLSRQRWKKSKSKGKFKVKKKRVPATILRKEVSPFWNRFD